MKFILARKLNMTQLFTEDGKVIPVTVLEAPVCKVTLVRTAERDHYRAVQIASGKKKREFRITEGEYQVGQDIKVTDFTPGEVVNVSGISKGRGFAGPMKRHGFHGAPASHGHDHPRAVGSIGQRFPQHVRPGLRMAGHMGSANATAKNSIVVAVDPEKNLIFLKGGVPGAPQGLLEIFTTGAKKELPKLNQYSVAASAQVEAPQTEIVSPSEEAKPEEKTT